MIYYLRGDTMLIRFEIENYRSFLEKNSYSSISRNKSESSEFFYLNTFKNNRTNEYYLKSSAIIGKNAGGKSNFIRAIKDFVFIIANSFNRPNFIDRIQHFKLVNTNDKPTKFLCEFLEGDNWYKYSYSVFNSKIYEEKLEIKVKSWATVYERTSPEYKSINFPKKYNSRFNKLLEHTKENVLFLSVLNQFNIEMAKNILSYFVNNYTVITPSGITRSDDVNDTEDIISDENNVLRDSIIDFIKTSDLGITDIYATIEKREKNEKIEKLAEFLKQNELGEIDSTDEYTKLMFKHKIYGINSVCDGDYSFERGFLSDGTNRMINLAGAIFYTLQKGGVLIIDEIEHKLHHILVKKIIEMFNSIHINKKNAQLIFTSHDLLILDEDLRRDQIWIVDKTVCNRSKLYNLLDFPGVTKKTDILKQYLLGIYRGIPEMKF
jgi:uncharacterized protein